MIRISDDNGSSGRFNSPQRCMGQQPGMGAVRPSRGSLGHDTGRPVMNEDQPIRHELVRTIRAQIDAGTYDSDAKLEVAFDRLVGSMDLTA